MRREYATRRSSWCARGIDLVQHLDPAGVGARDLRECLLIQIAAQQQEFEPSCTRKPCRAESDEDPHRQPEAEAEAQIEERRRSMEVAALIVDRHLHLLQKRDLKDLARAAQDYRRRSPCGHGVHPHPRPAARPPLQPRADAADRARRGFSSSAAASGSCR